MAETIDELINRVRAAIFSELRPTNAGLDGLLRRRESAGTTVVPKLRSPDVDEFSYLTGILNSNDNLAIRLSLQTEWLYLHFIPPGLTRRIGGISQHIGGPVWVLTAADPA